MRPRSNTSARRFAGCVALVLASTLRSGRVDAAPPEPEPAQAADEPRVLLLSDESELAFAIARAIRTELNDVEVALEVIPLQRAVDLRDRVGVAEQSIAERAALGAVWVEVDDEVWVAYLVVAEGSIHRSIVGESEAERIEAAAVVIRHLATELLEGRSIGLIPVEVEPEVEPEPALEPDGVDEPEPDAAIDRQPVAPWRLGERARVRLQGGYVGQAWAPQRPWASGVELSAEVRLRVGVHVGVGYGVFASLTQPVRRSTGLGVAEVVVRRFPAALVVGYQHVWDRSRVALDAQLRLSSEFVDRSATDLLAERPLPIRPRLVVVPVIEPRLQLDWLFRPPLSLNLALGLRVNTIDYSYGLDIADSSDNSVEHREYLGPYVVAPTLQIGLGVFL